MSSYKAPERNTAAFISSYHPKKVIATDHTHSSIVSGDVKASGDNTFSGSNTYTDANPVKYTTNSNTTSLLFEKDGEASVNASIAFRVDETYGDVNGQLTMSAHKLVLEGADGATADSVIIDNGIATFAALPVCSATPSSDTQLTTKAYVDSVGGVSLSADNTFSGENTFSDDTAFSTQIVIGSPSRNDNETNSLGKLVCAGPLSTPSTDFSSSTAILRVTASNATNGLQMGVGGDSYSYEPWIQGSFDNSTSGSSSHDSKKIRLNPAGSNIVVNGTEVSSDDRVKINETIIRSATSTLMKLKPQTYTRYAGMDASGQVDLNSWSVFESGLITQEVYYDAPELRHLVNVPSDADLSGNAIQTSIDPQIDPDYSNWGSSIATLNYTGLISYLIKSNQEQETHIQSLETRIAALEHA